MIDEQLSKTICLWGLNYLLLSTLFISVIWSLCKGFKIQSESLQDHLWKLSLVGPLVCSLVFLVWKPADLNWNVAVFFETDANVIPRSQVSIEPVANESLLTPIIQHKVERLKLENSRLETNILPPSPTLPEPVVTAVIPSATELPEFRKLESSLKLPQPASLPVVEFNQFQPPPSSIEEPTHREAIERSVGAKEFESSKKTVTRQMEFVSDSTEKSLMFGWWQFIATTICCVLFVGSMRAVLSSVILSRRVRRFNNITTGPVFSSLQKLQRRTNCQFNIQLFEGTEDAEPAAFGIWRKRILVPSSLYLKLKPDEVDALLAHELSHLSRRDPVWALSLSLICKCVLWQPLNFLALRNWRVSAELACDSQALASGVDHLSLARCLTRVASWQVSSQPVIGMGASTTSLGKRVEKLVDTPVAEDKWTEGWRKNLRWGCVLALLVLFSFFIPRLSWTSEALGSILTRNDLLTIPAEAIAPADPVRTDPSMVEIPTISPHPGIVAPEDLSLEINQLTADLQYALELLNEQEEDPDIQAAIATVQSRVQRLNAKAKHIEYSSRGSNRVSIDH